MANVSKLNINNTEYNIKDSVARANIPSLPVSTSNGGTGNSYGYIRTGQKVGTTIGTGATAEGRDNTASGNYSHAEGGSVIASGLGSHAEGGNTTASGVCSHVEGSWTTASENSSHAEGYQTVASGQRSHAEGVGTIASGYCAHSEGYVTEASGYHSHVGGFYTRADYEDQTAIGHYNDNKSTTLFEVGNGSADDTRSNAFEVHSNGNAVVSGDLSVSGTIAGNAVETIPTSGSSKLITSGGVATALANKQNTLTLPLSKANGGTGNTLGQAAQLDAPRDSVSPNAAVTAAPIATVRIDECNPNATGAPESNWFHYITVHSVDTRYGSQLALGMTANKVYSRDYNGGTWGAWKRLAFTSDIPTVGSAAAKNYTDSSSASALGTGTSLTTERDVYYGTPTINGSKSYTSSTSIYAPTSAGTSGYFLKSNGSGAPTWAAAPSGGGMSTDEIYYSDTEYKTPFTQFPYFACILPVSNVITSIASLITYINQYGFIPLRYVGHYSGSETFYNEGRKPVVELLGISNNNNSILLQGHGLYGKGAETDYGRQGIYIFNLSSYNVMTLSDSVSAYGSGLHRHYFTVTLNTNTATRLGARIHWG